MKKYFVIPFIIFSILLMVGCSTKEDDSLVLAAAASLKNPMEELIPMFEERYEDVSIQENYDSSGRLQVQIEEGAEFDIFISAATQQMDALLDRGLIKKDSVVPLLENRMVLIVPDGNPKGITGFEDLPKADIIAIGDPESVPAGQYAKELLGNLSLWDECQDGLSLGTNVIEVLNWVAEGSANGGILYATDVVHQNRVQVVEEAPQGSVSRIIYPAGLVKSTTKEEQSKLFLEFLQQEEADRIFESYGFEIINRMN